MGLTRREFLCAAALELRRAAPEMVLYNGQFLTMDEGNPSAEAVGIAGGRFLFAGSNGDVRAAAG